jgi:hypothetical protein
LLELVDADWVLFPAVEKVVDDEAADCVVA